MDSLQHEFLQIDNYKPSNSKIYEKVKAYLVHYAYIETLQALEDTNVITSIKKSPKKESDQNSSAEKARKQILALAGDDAEARLLQELVCEDEQKINQLRNEIKILRCASMADEETKDFKKFNMELKTKRAESLVPEISD